MQRALLTSMACLALGQPVLALQDECASAPALVLGTVSFDTTPATPSAGLLVCGAGPTRDLWYRVVTPGPARYRISLCGSSFDTVAELYTGECNALVLVTCNDDDCGLQSRLEFNATGGFEYFLRVGGFGAHNFGPGTIALTTATPAPPVNDDFINPLPLFEGTTPGSNVGATNGLQGWGCGSPGADVWYFTVATGTQLEVETCGSTIDTALQVFRRLSAIALESRGCSANGSGCAGTGERLIVATQPGETYLIRIGGEHGATGPFVVTMTGGEPFPPQPIGTSPCPASLPNSTGQRGEISATGSTSVTHGDVTLHARSLPAGSFGFFIVSRTQGAGTLGGGGLCLGGTLGRLNAPPQIFQTSAGGSASLRLDLGALPEGPVAVAVSPGDRWHFQAWHRDTVGGLVESNLTSSVAIDFD